MPMKSIVMLVLVLIASASVLTLFQAESVAETRRSPSEEPNFKPEITRQIIDGREVEIIEFKSKFAD